MKTDIHPNYVDATIVCSCGNTVQTRSTKENISVEICSNCHPFYTGKQKLMDTGGRLARFQAKLETTAGAEDTTSSKKKKASVRTFTPAVDPKVLAAKAARAEAKALEDAKKRKEAEEAEKVARAEAKAAKEAAAAEAAANPPAEAPEAEAEAAPAEETPAEAPAEEAAPAEDAAPAEEAAPEA